MDRQSRQECPVPLLPLATLLVILLCPVPLRAEPPPLQRQAELSNMLQHDCGACHGMTLQGGLGPALTAEALAGKPDALLLNTILLGREGTAMPPWQGIITIDEADWLVHRLREGHIKEVKYE